MRIEKKFAEKGYRAKSLDDTRILYPLEYFTCNWRGCWEPAMKKIGDNFRCEKHLKEAK